MARFLGQTAAGCCHGRPRTRTATEATEKAECFHGNHADGFETEQEGGEEQQLAEAGKAVGQLGQRTPRPRARALLLLENREKHSLDEIFHCLYSNTF